MTWHTCDAWFQSADVAQLRLAVEREWPELEPTECAPDCSESNLLFDLQLGYRTGFRRMSVWVCSMLSLPPVGVNNPCTGPPRWRGCWQMAAARDD